MGKVDIYKPHEEDKLKKRKWIAPRYYDYPDGEDLLGKLNYTTKVAFFTSSFFGLIYANMHPAPPTFRGKLLRCSKFVIPAVGMAAAFTCVTYYATNFRKKDDQLNYALGGAAAGLVLAPLLGHSHWMFWAPVYCALFGIIQKDCKMKGIDFIPEIRRSNFNSYFLRKDGTFITDPVGGNWTKELDK